MPLNEDKFSFTIFNCIREANVEKLENCVRRGADVNEIDKSRDKFSPLHCAAYYGSLECLHWLLWQEADPTITTPKGWTVAHVAAIRGQYACLQALIKNGVSMNSRDNRGQTPPHLASAHGHSQSLQAIIRSGADISLQDTNGWTPTHSAAYHGRLGCLQFLKTAGGKLDDCDNDGNTPAHLAAMEGHLPCLKYILSNAHNTNSIVSARNDQGDTPKTLAQQFFKDKIVEYLETVEWDRDHPEQAENLAFPAHVAAFNGDLEHVKLLVEQGVISVNERDDKGSSIAHKAAGQGHLNVLRWLIENGADLTQVNSSNETARDVAKRFSQLACVKLLESEVVSDEELGNEMASAIKKGEIQLSSQQKKDAKGRAKKRLEEIEKQLVIARSNYLQLGGRMEDTLDSQLKSDQARLKEQERTIAEMKDELDFERVRKEKLEMQLDHTRQELEKAVKSIRDYETKVLVLEKYLQHTNKEETKVAQKKVGGRTKSPTKSSARGRSRSRQNKNADERDEVVVSSGRKSSSKSGGAYTPEAHSNSKTAASNKILDSLTSWQLKDIRRAFEDIDRNRSGYVSRKELRQAFRHLDIRASDDEIDIIVNQMDTNDDGRVDFYEFARVMARSYYKKYTREEIRDAFKKFDLNNTGRISPEELYIVMSKMHRHVPRGEIDDLVKKVDADRDGLISIDEFIDILSI